MSDGTVQQSHYAVRRVNPFEGVLQIVETRKARAYSPDGAVWQLQVLTERPDHTWRSISGSAPIEQFFSFGLWDVDGGLQKIPANPVMDIGAMTDAANHLIDVLHELVARVPFTLVDRHECWAIDDQGGPIALLATTEEPDIMRDMRIADWQATRRNDPGFISASLQHGGIPANDPDDPRRHARQLEQLIHRHAVERAWYRRDAQDGTGTRADRSPQAPALAADRFPPLGLRPNWPLDVDTALVHDYLAWQAPRLLLLQHIDDALRASLEHQACRRAEELTATYRLIPRIIDRDRIEAARVEARLRRAAV